MSGHTPPVADARDQIATEILKVHQDSYGTGAGTVTVHILDDTVLVILDDLELTAIEATLFDDGAHKTIKDVRDTFQEVIGSTFSAIVERATGRRVTSFLSNTSVSSLYSVEFFRLGTQ